ncbi:sulfurtransferase [Sphingopyxis sp. QXT-31]|uniref:DNA phosphorothioation system sulfurtransferase DndC n=1 Tax=Sphingopyxis sp. QXT-31 TaxID=1357916 RepID=UPI0009794E17|nr:DNA phosphorothioation system sulfurtransferase DndC [Sphingopyxis sp. QXT-31]APZ97623.1 sulfurtransferase [Sphingopyxis sp. QXT-31]
MATLLNEVEDLGSKLEFARAELLAEYRAAHDFPWIIGFSGGKDSTLVAQLVFEMLLDLPPSARTRPVHIVANDTLVEAPLIARHLDAMLERMRSVVPALRLPVTVVKTSPKIDQTFWVNLIGRGYPSPSRSFRWCTDRMKIQPTSHYIRSTIDETGQAILLLGVRRQESATRAMSVNRYSNGERLNPHNSLAGCLVFRPIVEFSTDEVWQVLLQRRPPWGGSHRQLVTLYRNAAGGECPLVLDKDDAPSCGTSSSRFGCWTCTVIVKDHSMEGFIGTGNEHLEPLMDFRDWLAEIRQDAEMRMARRRTGARSHLADGSLIPGPFTFEARRMILDRLIKVQAEVGEPLISESEIQQIHSIWADDATRLARAAEEPKV